MAAAVALGVTLIPADAVASNSAYLSNKGRVAPPAGAQTLCKAYSWACAVSPSDRAVTSSQMQLVQSVNLQVNRSTRPIEDRRQYGEDERWAVPTSRGGDCEDYALAKKRELIRRGIAPQRLLIATVLDRKRNPHAVLVFRSDEGDLVLDNLTNRIRTWRETRYIFLRMQDPERPARWVNVFLGG